MVLIADTVDGFDAFDPASCGCSSGVSVVVISPISTLSAFDTSFGTGHMVIIITVNMRRDDATCFDTNLYDDDESALLEVEGGGGIMMLR